MSSSISMDKSWIKLKNRLYGEYWRDGEEFISPASRHLNLDELTRCPFKKYLNRSWEKLSKVSAHIIDHVFHPNYKVGFTTGRMSCIRTFLIFQLVVVEAMSTVKIKWLKHLLISPMRWISHLKKIIQNTLNWLIMKHQRFKRCLRSCNQGLWLDARKMSSFNFLVKLLRGTFPDTFSLRRTGRPSTNGASDSG